jgi:hypothetical protein
VQPNYVGQLAEKLRQVLATLTVNVFSVHQCCQLADISAAKHKSGPIKISAAGKIRGRIFADFTKNGRKVAELF